METNNILFRAHYYGEIMTGVAKGWTVEQSLTTKRRLVKIYRELMYGKRTTKGNKYTEKGILAEEDGLTLYSSYRGYPFFKNTERLENDLYTGEYDTAVIEDGKLNETVDIKNSWDLDTFPCFLDVPDKDYEYQGNVYMDLTGAQKHTVAYTLVNTPSKIITDEKRRLAWDMGIIDIETESYINACKEIEKNSIHDMALFLKHNPNFDFHIPLDEWKWDIPKKDRVHEITVERNEGVLAAMRKRGIECRAWMNENLFQSPLVMLATHDPQFNATIIERG